MRTLIIATSMLPQHAIEEINTGKRPRLDYLELDEKVLTTGWR